MEHITTDSGRGSGPASYQTAEADDDGSLDSATFAGGGLMSGSDHSASGAASDGVIGTSPIFGSDRDSLTPSPRPSASIDDELDNEFDLEQVGIFAALSRYSPTSGAVLRNKKNDAEQKSVASCLPVCSVIEVNTVRRRNKRAGRYKVQCTQRGRRTGYECNAALALISRERRTPAS